MPANSLPAENKMGTMPVKKLIFQMALPLIFSMMIQALYNIVDSVFVSRISEDALTAVSLAFPIQNLMIAFATGTGVGINALLSRRLGEQNREQAEKVANVGLLLAVCTAAVFALLGGFFSHTYFALQKGISPLIAQYGAEYLSIVCIGSLGIFVEITSERIDSAGESFTSFRSTSQETRTEAAAKTKYAAKACQKGNTKRLLAGKV